jgi:hypothetical protein
MIAAGEESDEDESIFLLRRMQRLKRAKEKKRMKAKVRS